MATGRLPDDERELIELSSGWRTRLPDDERELIELSSQVGELEESLEEEPTNSSPLQILV